MNGSRNRIFSSILLSVITTLAVISVAVFILYSVAVQEKQKWLKSAVEARAKLIENISDSYIDSRDSNQRAVESVISILKNNTVNDERIDIFGETGEFVLGRINGDYIECLNEPRFQGLGTNSPLAVNSELAIPMSRALDGQSGLAIGLDYRGKQVLSAYTHIESLGIGLVAKIDLSEMRTPYIQATILIIAITLAFILLSVFVRLRLGTSLIFKNQIHEQPALEASIPEQFEQGMNKSGVEINPARFRAVFTKYLTDDKYLISLLLVLGFLMFLLDVVVPLGIAAGAPYIMLVLLSSWANNSRLVMVVACVSSLLIVVGAVLSSSSFSSSGSELMIVSANRALALLVLWVAAMHAQSRKLSENLLIDQAKKLAATSAQNMTILETANDAMIIINETGRIGVFNNAAEKMFGFNKQEAIGKNVSMLMPEFHRSAHDSYLKKYIETGVSTLIGKTREIEAVRKNGSTFFGLLSVSEVKFEGARLYTGILHDISDLKAIEEKLKEYTVELEARNDELTNFTYVASHDLQEPLRKIMSFSELLKSDLRGRLDEDSKENLDFLIGAASRMRALVQDLLNLSRAGRRDLKLKSVSMDDCLDEALESLDESISESGAKIIRDELPVVQGDRRMLTQLFQNLVSNALKFTTGTEPSIHIMANKKEGVWMFCVKDNGIGIESKYHEQIFSPFKRLHGRDKYDGTGIGLAICRKSVERHHGKLWVESKLNKGSEFIFTLNEGDLTPKQDY